MDRLPSRARVLFLVTLLSLIVSPWLAASEVVLDEKNPWPTVFELNRGEPVTLRTPTGATVVRLLEVHHLMEPDYWTGSGPGNETFAGSRVVVDVNGRRAELLCRPYEMPKTLGGVRLYVETTQAWRESRQLRPLEKGKGDVRLSAVPEGRSWGPEEIRFPVADYRWRSATYQNTWNSLVPFNALYYHRGEDLGAIPDRLDLRAILDGRVVASPLPKGDGASNGLIIDLGSGAQLRYSHMNVETIRTRLLDGVAVKRGETLAKTGCTWSGRRSQYNDPHVHLGLFLHGAQVSFYPAMVEAYFRTYDDPVLAMAGGFGFAKVGGSYRLDGSRSLARSGGKIVSYRWRLHDGRELDGPCHSVQYEKPGFYAEELIVRTEAGEEDRDAIHVRIYDPKAKRSIAYGWAYYGPARGIRSGDEVLFWNRLAKTRDARIDFGDGRPAQPIGQDARHAYARPGVYTVSIAGRGPGEEPVSVKLRVRVEGE